MIESVGFVHTPNSLETIALRGASSKTLPSKFCKEPLFRFVSRDVMAIHVMQPPPPVRESPGSPWVQTASCPWG